MTSYIVTTKDAANLVPHRAHDPVNRYAAIEEMCRRDDEEFYLNLLRYSRGEPNGIMPGTVGMDWAEEAKKGSLKTTQRSCCQKAEINC